VGVVGGAIIIHYHVNLVHLCESFRVAVDFETGPCSKQLFVSKYGGSFARMVSLFKTLFCFGKFRMKLKQERRRG
jgi:hypothetical protein